MTEFNSDVLDRYLHKIADSTLYYPKNKYEINIVQYLEDNGLITTIGTYFASRITERGIELIQKGGFVGIENSKKRKKLIDKNKSRIYDIIWEIFKYIIVFILGYLMQLLLPLSDK